MGYNDEYQAALDNTEAYWAGQADRIAWFKKPETTLEKTEFGTYSWYPDGELNSCYLAVDYHVENGRGEQVALYYDSDPGLVLGTRSKVSVEEFKSDFNLSDNEFAAYFDSSSENSLNRRLLTCTHWPTETVPDSTLTPYDETGEGQDDSTTAPDELPSPNLTGNQVPPPTLNSGWEAEQYVHSALQADGWDPYDVSRQCLGYDIFAQKGRRKLFVEVKSSLGACSPTLTSREWQQAKQHENYYVLAIIENFNHTGENTIYWIQDPANSCHSTTNKTISHGIPRSSWTQVSVTIDQI